MAQEANSKSSRTDEQSDRAAAERASRVNHPNTVTIFMAMALWLTTTNPAKAQAWVPPRGEGSISFTYQTIDNTGHRRTNGVLVPHGTSLDMSLYLEAEYALTNRLSLTAGLPYVFAKYTDPNPPAPPIPYLPVDQCHCWQSGLQDFGITARYNLASGVFALTPSVSLGVPSHDYNFRGESALGRDLREVRIGVDAGRRLDAISRNLVVQGRYSYAFVERVLGISSNRSNASAEVAYLVKRKLSVRGQAFWQRTHGGLRFGSPPPADLVFPGEVNTPELLYQHDRFLRDNYWRAGGALAYSLPRADLFAAYTAFVSGTDTHAGRAFTIGFSMPFRLGGSHR
ncbi:MAG: hypothetical protein LAQ69_17640 [Acidobacteriia bacterium]|nr:hypothetical protein [Terriglobia bacterium]